MKTGSTSTNKFFKTFAHSMDPDQDDRCNLTHTITIGRKVGLIRHFVYNTAHERVCERENPLNKPIYATIRNPFDWYLSYYLHIKRKELLYKSDLFPKYKVIGLANEYFFGYTDLPDLPTSFESFVKDYTCTKECNIGFFTHFLCDFTLKTSINNLILTRDNVYEIFDNICGIEKFFKLENITEMVRFFYNKGWLYDSPLVKRSLTCFGFHNNNSKTSKLYQKTKPTIDYYDQEMIDLVREKDAFIFERFEYD